METGSVGIEKRISVFIHPTRELRKLVTKEDAIVVFTNKRSQAKVYTVRCISGLVVYGQYIHHCSSQVAPRLAHGGESSIRSSAPLVWLRPPG